MKENDNISYKKTFLWKILPIKRLLSSQLIHRMRNLPNTKMKIINLFNSTQIGTKKKPRKKYFLWSDPLLCAGVFIIQTKLEVVLTFRGYDMRDLWSQRLWEFAEWSFVDPCGEVRDDATGPSSTKLAYCPLLIADLESQIELAAFLFWNWFLEMESYLEKGTIFIIFDN